MSSFTARTEPKRSTNDLNHFPPLCAVCTAGDFFVGDPLRQLLWHFLYIFYETFASGKKREPIFYENLPRTWSNPPRQNATIKLFRKDNKEAGRAARCIAIREGKLYEKDHSSFVSGCLRRCRSDPDRLRLRCFRHRARQLCCSRLHCGAVRQGGDRRFHFHEECHRSPDRGLCRGRAGRDGQL